MRSFTQQEAKQFFKKARRVVKHAGFDILIAPSDAPLSRLMVVTPKHLGNAVTRNKIRRQIKAIVREQQLLQESVDYAVLVKKPALEMEFGTLKQELVSALKNPSTSSG